jgi:uncharacterized protein YciW
MDDISKLVDRAVATLQEHCSSVHVMVSVQQDGCTRSIHRGAGDYYARLGLAHEFIDTTKQQDSAAHIATALKENEE